jgi:polysaccharide deacetylase family protein (PEP-CTERM system associated)
MSAPAGHRPPPVNVMTVDVEEYFHVSAFGQVVDRGRWDAMESRVVPATDRLLEMFAAHGVHGTFFVLGWVAERHPALVRRIADAGHEIASHSYWHRLVYDLTPDEFRADLRRARQAIEAACGVEVIGYRAPSFSLTERSLWAFDVLAEEGYRYDASVFPIWHDRYGIPSAPRHPHVVSRGTDEVIEMPGSAALIGRGRVPIGGGYFRWLPYACTAWAIRRVNESEGLPCGFYLHPWEIDPDQPRIAVDTVTQWRHYTGLQRTEARLARLLREFRWGTVRDRLLTGNPVLPRHSYESLPVAAQPDLVGPQYP